MAPLKCSFLFSVVLTLLPIVFLNAAQAEERKISKAEQMATAGSKDAGEAEATLGMKRRAKLTEEQAISQLKFMMVKGWSRMEEQLLKDGTFQPFGLTLSPQGKFRPVFVDTGTLTISNENVLGAIAKNLEAIAATRSVWAVGLMYIQAQEKKDGTFIQRIQVMTEHIAGWAHHWSYPFKIIDGVVKLGNPTEANVKAVYFEH